jgi:SAM-dependent methyltransferase
LRLPRFLSRIFSGPLGQVDIREGAANLIDPVSQACTAAQMLEPGYTDWSRRFGEVPRFHRKQWEWCYIARVLEHAGMLQPGRHGLGMGVGVEPLVSLFASLGPHILATDLEPDDAAGKGWVETNQHAVGKSALNQRDICPPDVFEANVDFRFADMNAIPQDIGTFDFVWSSCAFEHLGSIKAGRDFIMNAARLLKPGGISVHTTEFNCSSNDQTLDHSDTVLFRRRDFEAMARDLMADGFEVALNFDMGDQPIDRHIDQPPYCLDNHLKLQLSQWVTTSFGLVARRPAQG